jgi:exodeoxyribonuclease VII small subunit
MSKNEQKPVEQMNYEEAYGELEKVVAALETGEKPLEESMQLFERGLALTKHCASFLDKAELKVKQLVGEELEDFKVEE